MDGEKEEEYVSNQEEGRGGEEMRPLPKWHSHPNEPTSILIMMSTARESSSPNPFFPGRRGEPSPASLPLRLVNRPKSPRGGSPLRRVQDGKGEEREVTILGEREQREIRTTTTDR